MTTFLLEGSTPSEQAHSLGLKYGGFGRWVDPKIPGKTIAYTIDNKLVRASKSTNNSKEKEKSTTDEPRSEPQAKKNLGKASILNFDERLLNDDVLITIQHQNGKETLVTPTEFNMYNKEGKKYGDKILYKKTSQYTTVSQHGLALYNQLIQRLHSGGGTFYILCERERMSDIVSYLHSMDIVKGIILVPMDMHKPEKKANFVDNKLKKGYTQINFFDDDAKDISAVNKLKAKHKELTATLNSRLLNSVVL